MLWIGGILMVHRDLRECLSFAVQRHDRILGIERIYVTGELRVAKKRNALRSPSAVNCVASRLAPDPPPVWRAR